MSKWDLKSIEINDIMEHLEDKGREPSSIHWLLYANGFSLYVWSPFNELLNEFNRNRNLEAIEKTWIQVQYFKHYE